MRRIALLAGLAAAALGCSEVKEIGLRDSEGRAFGARCKEAHPCALQQRSGPRWPGNRMHLALHQGTRVVGVCNTSEEGTVATAADCRALVCNADEDCPPAHGRPSGTCLNGLCTDESRPIEADDAVMLCLFGAGLGHDTPSQIERSAMGRNCGTPCEVPTACRKP